MPAKIQVIFYSTYGHVWKLAEAVAEGARQVPGSDVKILQVTETLSADILAKMGATEAKKAFAHVPIADPQQLGDPTRSSWAHPPATAAPPRRCRRLSTQRAGTG